MDLGIIATSVRRESQTRIQEHAMLLDLFKKLPKQEQVAVRRDSSLPDHLKRTREAALEFLSILDIKLASSDGSLHAGTMLSAAAWLTGTSLYRSFGFKEDAPSGSIIRSNEVNATWEGLMHLLEQYSFQRTDIPVGRLMMAATGAPDCLRPQVEMLYVQSELQDRYNAVMKKHGFGYLEGARVGIILCSILIQQYHAARIIEPETAVGLVAEKALEAARTIPSPLEH
jgi:hypothetical protein